MEKKKNLTAREKKQRAMFKRQMQEKGIFPPDKPKLNRKKFIEEARAEWNARSESYLWDHFLAEALAYMLCRKENRSCRISPEAVGAAKVIKLAVRLKQFSDELAERGEKEYTLSDQYEYIRDILEA